jgi:glycosyltransferase involved in cell wall biosynthesis
MKKVIVIFTNYGPYHIARVGEFHQVAKENDWEVIGLEFSRSESIYPWKVDIANLPYSLITLFNDKVLEEIEKIRLVKSLFKVLEEHQPFSIVVAGYSPFAMFCAMIWGKLRHKPVILMTESKEDDSQRDPLKEAIKRSLLKNYKSALVGGAPQKRYLKKLGMASEKIFIGYDVVNNDFFTTSKETQHQNPIHKKFFLSINRFIKKKNLHTLISAYAIYRQKLGSNAWDLVLCGDGELKEEIKKQIFNLQLESFIHLPGFLQSEEQLPYFAHAGCFIHASTQEQWGLVVNEAMASGLPVLVSKKCGCFEDLVIEGENGFGFNPESIVELSYYMERMSSGEINLSEFGKKSSEHIKNFSPMLFATNLVKAIQCSLAVS